MKKVLSQAYIIVIYGMSTGETDQTYWLLVSDRILVNTLNVLIIHDYNESSWILPRAADKNERIVKEHFFRNLKVTDTQLKILSSQTYVISESEDFFRMENFKYKLATNQNNV